MSISGQGAIPPTMAELELIAEQCLSPTLGKTLKKNEKKGRWDVITESWKEISEARSRRSILKSRTGTNYNNKTFCKLINQKIKEINENLKTDCKDELLIQYASDLAHMIAICALLKKSGAEKQLISIENSINKMNENIENILNEKINQINKDFEFLIREIEPKIKSGNWTALNLSSQIIHNKISKMVQTCAKLESFGIGIQNHWSDKINYLDESLKNVDEQLLQEQAKKNAAEVTAAAEAAAKATLEKERVNKKRDDQEKARAAVEKAQAAAKRADKFAKEAEGSGVNAHVAAATAAEKAKEAEAAAKAAFEKEKEDRVNAAVNKAQAAAATAKKYAEEAEAAVANTVVKAQEIEATVHAQPTIQEEIEALDLTEIQPEENEIAVFANLINPTVGSVAGPPEKEEMPTELQADTPTDIKKSLENVTAIPDNYFILIDQLESSIAGWEDEIASIANGNFIDYSSGNHIEILKQCNRLISIYSASIKQNIDSDLKNELVNDIKKMLQEVAKIQNQILPKLIDYFKKYFQATESQIRQDLQDNDNQNLNESLATFNYFILGLDKTIQEIDSISQPLNQALRVEGQPSPFSKEINAILNPLKKHHMALSDLQKNIKEIKFELADDYQMGPDIDVSKQWDSLQIRHTFRFQNPDMIDTDEIMRAIRSENMPQGIPVSSWEPPPHSFKLNSLKNIAMMALYCLKLPLEYAHAKFEAQTPHEKAQASPEKEPASHRVEPANRDQLPVSEEIATMVDTYGLFSNKTQENNSTVVQESSDVEGGLPASEVETFIPRWELLKNIPKEEDKKPTISISPILESAQLTSLASQNAEVKRLHTFLSSSSQIDSTIFAHLVGHGNPMIHKGQEAAKPLEWGALTTPISYQLEIARSMLSAMQKVSTQDQTSDLCCGTIIGDPSISESVRDNPALLKTLIEQLGIAQLIQEYSNFDEYRSRISEQVNGLNPGQSFFFLGGWRGKESGHAVTWVVTRQNDGKLTIQLHNTGEGLQYHYSKAIGLEGRFLLVTEIVDVDPNQFTSSTFIQGVFNLQTINIPEHMKNWNAADIYGGLLVGMGGSVSSKQYSLSELAQPQFVGICTMESVMSALGSFMEGEASAILYRYWATLKGTVSYFEKIRTKTEPTEEQRRLLYDGLKTLAGLADKAQEAGVLTDGELVYTNTLIKEIKQHLQEMEKGAAFKFFAEEPPVTFNAPSQPLQINITGLQLASNMGNQARIEDVVRPLVCIESEAFSANPATIVQDLKVLFKEIHLGNHERHNYLEVQKAIRDIVLKIPLQDLSFWSKIDEETANKLLTQFSEISKELLWSLIHNDEDQSQKTHLSPENYLCQAKLLTLADYIVRNYNNPLGMKLPSLFQAIASKAQGTPEWEVEHSKINEYWQQFFLNNAINQNEDFFGFKFYPAGNDGTVNFRFNMNNNFLKINWRTAEQLENKIEYKWFFGYIDQDSNPIQPKQFDFVKQWAIENLEKSVEDPTETVLKNIKDYPVLRDAFLISYVFNFMGTGSFDTPSENRYDFSKGININFEKMQKEIQSREGKLDLACSGISYSLFGRSPYISRNTVNSKLVNRIEVHRRRFADAEAVLTHIKFEQLLKNNQIEFHNYLKELFKDVVDFNDIELNRRDSSDIVVKQGLAERLQQFREIQHLFSHSTVQIEQTFGYFLGKGSENAHLLSEPKFQSLFYFLITEGNLLRQRIKENPKAASEMAADYRNRLDSAEKSWDVNLMIFLAGMSARLQEVYESEKENNPSLFLSASSPEFLSSRNILASIMQSNEINAGQRALASRELVISFRRQKTIIPKDAPLLIQAVINTRIYKIPEGYHNYHAMTHEVDSLIRDYFMPQLRTLMQGEERDNILSRILTAIIPNAKKGEWTSPDNFPYYVSPCGNYRLNIVEGSITPINSGIVVPFDYSLLEKNKYLKEIFGDNPPSTVIKTEDGIGIQSKTGESYQFVSPIGYLNQRHSPILLRKFGDEWYELQEGSSSYYGDITFDNQAVLAGNHLWGWGYSSTPEKNAKKDVTKLILTDKISKKALFTAEITKTVDKKLQVQKVIKLDEDERETDFILVDSNRKEIDAFRRLEAPNYIMAWSQGGVIKNVELPRFGLTFTTKEINGKRLAVTDQFPGYFLAEGVKQHIPELGNFRNYLHLQRIETDGTVSEKVIFARQPLKPYTQGTYLTDAEPERNIKSDATLPPQKIIEFQLIKGELIPSTADEEEAIEANLFMAMTHLAERHVDPSDINTNPYLRAHHYLEKANNQILRQREGVSKNTLEILTWIINEDITKDKHPDDKHPDAIALRLKAEFILNRDRLDFKSSGVTGSLLNNYISLLANYIVYLSHLRFVDASICLSRVDELHLLNIIGVEDERLAYRLKQLTSESDLIIQDRSNEAVINPALTSFSVNPSFPDDWTDKLIDKSLLQFQTPIFLRSINTVSRFAEYYAIAKDELTDLESIKKLNENMGLNLQLWLSKETILQEMKTALKMTLAADESRVDGFAIKILLAVATDPNQFSLSSEELSEALLKLKEKKEKKRRLEDERNSLSSAEKWKERKEELQRQLEILSTAIKESEDYLEKYLKTPTNDLESQLTVSINKSQKTGVESDRLKHEKAMGRQPEIPLKKDLTFAECINLAMETDVQLSNRTLDNPIIPMQGVEYLIKIAPGQPASQNVSSATPLFQGTPKNPYMVEFFKAAENDLAAYVKKLSSKPNYEVPDSAKLVDLEKALFLSITDREKEIRAQEVGLLQFANKGPSRAGELAARDLQVEQGSLKLLTLDELNRAFFQRDLEILHKRNPHLSKEEMAQLFTKIENYLLDATYLQHEKRILKKAESLRKSIGNLESPALQENIRAFIETVESVRVYNPQENPEYLVFEYYNDILLWRQQVETLDAFNKKDRRGALIELAMGLGKSTVISPFLVWMKADGEQLSTILTTEPLLPSLAKELQETNERVFAQKTRILAIKREEITLERLKRLFDNLDEVRRERFALAWTAHDILSLYNQWVELNEQAYELQTAGTLSEGALSQYSEKRNLFLKNFQLLIESASLTIDEIHKVLDILQSHSFTFGMPKDVHQDIVSGVVKLVKTIISDKDLLETIRWEFLAQSKGESFTEESYQETIKGKIIDALVDRSLALNNKIYSEFFQKLTPDEKLLLKDYLAEGKKAQQGYDLLSSLESHKGIYAVAAKTIRNELATLKESINNVFSHTAAKKPLVDMGEDSEGELIIPYHDGVPTVNSIHGNILERILYSIEYDLSQGVSVDVVREKIQQLKDKFKTEELNKEIYLSEFNRLVGGSKEFNLMKFDKKEYAKQNYEKIAKIINKDPHIVLELIVEQRLSKIKVYAKEIESSVHLIPILAKKEQGVSGMSGTIYNAPTFPRRIFQPPKLSDTQVKTLDILRKNSSPRVATLPTAKGMDKLKMVYDYGIESSPSLIDATGALSGLSNEEIARSMLKKLTAQKDSKIQGVVYYEGDIRKVVTVKDSKPIPYSKDMDKESLAAFWDLPHFTGADIILGQFMKANMIVGKDITLVSLMQAAWRLRGLAKGQTVNFIVPEEDKRVIRKMLKEHLGIEIAEDADLTFSQLVSYAYLNQGLQGGQHTYQSVQESMKVALIMHLSNIMWDPTMSPEDGLKIYSDTRSLFVKEETQEPWDRWGRPVKEIPTSEALQNLLKEWKEHPIVTKIRDNPTLYKGVDLTSLFKGWDNIIAEISGPLPEKVKKSTQSYGKTTEQTAEQALAQKVEKITDQHIDQQTAKKVYLYEGGEKEFLPRQRIPIDKPFRLKDSTPTSVEELAAISEDVLVKGPEEQKPKETGLCVKVNDLMQRNTPTQSIGNIFDENLLISLNLAPVQGLSKDIVQRIEAWEEHYRKNIGNNYLSDQIYVKMTWKGPIPKKGTQQIYVPFDKFQKSCTFVQVIQDKKTGRIKLKLIDEIEAAQLKNAGRTEKESTSLFQGAISAIAGLFQSDPIEVRVGLYQLQKSSIALDDIGGQPIDLTQPEVYENFMDLLVQAKFAAGKINFLPEEIPYLEKWLTKVGPFKAFEMIDVILNSIAKHDTRKSFSKSVLAQLFEKHGVSRDLIDSIK